MRTLKLTSPLMRGSDVLTLQRALKKRGYYHGPLDGAYGLLTAQAVYRGKYWYGWIKPDQVAGQYFLDIMRGDKKVRPDMWARRKLRLRRRPKQLPRHVMAKKAVSQIGVKESPTNSNRVLYSVWYGIIGPWCAMFITWCGDALFKSLHRGRTYAYVPFVVNDARAGRNYLTIAQSPLTGVLACFDWQGDRTSDHIGICMEERHLREWAPIHLEIAKSKFGGLAPNEFWCLEGNTSLTNDSNGGEVMLRKRHRRQVQLFVNPN